MKKLKEIDKIMQKIPKEWRYKWCGGENGLCACTGCVQIGNRIPMYEEVTGNNFFGDAEHIDETQIPDQIFEKFKLTKQEWESWKTRIIYPNYSEIIERLPIDELVKIGKLNCQTNYKYFPFNHLFKYSMYFDVIEIYKIVNTHRNELITMIKKCYKTGAFNHRHNINLILIQYCDILNKSELELIIIQQNGFLNLCNKIHKKLNNTLIQFKNNDCFKDKIISGFEENSYVNVIDNTDELTFIKDGDDIFIEET